MSKDRQIGPGTAFYLAAKAQGKSIAEIAKEAEAIARENLGMPPMGTAYIPRLQIPADEPERIDVPAPKPLEGNPDDEDGVVQWAVLTRGKDPRPACCPANIMQFLQTHLRGRTICRNEMTEEIMVDDVVFDDDMLTMIHMQLDRCSEVSGWSREHIAAVMSHLAAQNPKRSPVREYLQSLTWDGTPRVSHIVGSAVKTKYDLPIYAVFFEKFFLSCVARAMKPGVKADLVLILQSQKQGTRKSSFFETLAYNRKWFSDSSQGVTTKDAKQDAGQRWIIEWSELVATKTASHNAIKAFVSSNTDQFRPPYATNFVEKPRSCVMVGTTNDGAFFDAMQGERRYMIVPVAHIDIDWVRENRDQLWAETVHRWRAGERHWIDEELVDQQHEANSVARIIDPWEEIIRDWIEQEGTRIEGDLEYIIADDVQAECLKGLAREWTKADSMRLADVLRGLGFERSPNPIRVAGVRKRIWYLPKD